MPTGQTYTDEEIVVDGNDYTSCTFNRGKILYEGGAVPRFESCTFLNCVFGTRGAARRTIQYLMLLQAMGAREVVDGFIDEVRAAGEKHGE